MDQLFEWISAFWEWAGVEDHQNRVATIATAIGAIIAAVTAVVGVFAWAWKKLFGQKPPSKESGNSTYNETQQQAKSGDNATISQVRDNSGTVNQGIPPDKHDEIVQKHLDRLEKQHAEKIALIKQAAEAEKQILQQQFTMLQVQITNPKKTMTVGQQRMSELEDLLRREGNDIGGDRINAAIASLKRGDYSLADDIFAEIESRSEIEGELEIKDAARTAFGQGEVAEAQSRWRDAATHYARAARLDPGFDSLSKAREFAWRSGDFAAAERLGQDLLDWTDQNGTDRQKAMAMNEHAVTLNSQGRYNEAGEILTGALMLDRATIGDQHPDYAIPLNNLAAVVQAQGRYQEAERLYREALAIAQATIGNQHPDYATRLNNLAWVVQAQGRYQEAERLYREVLEIDHATIGDQHPDYAKHLNNLAGVVEALGRYQEAEGLYREALEIGCATIGDQHPDYATHLNNIASVVRAQGRYQEAEPLYREALEIDRATIGDQHPEYARHLNNLALVVEAQGRYDEAEPLYSEALEILRARLPEGHPTTITVQGNLDKLLAKMAKP